MPAWLLAPAARWIALGVGLVLLFGAWRVEAARREAAELRAFAAEAAVAGRDRAIEVLEASAADIAERVARYQPIRRAVDAAPSSRACVDAPAIRAALDGLRAQAATGAGGASHPAGVPAGTASAGRAR